MASNLTLAHGGDIPELDVLQIPHISIQKNTTILL